MLTEKQQKIVGFLVGILLSSIVIFRINLFDKSSFTVFLYKFFVFLAVFTIFYYFSKLLNVKTWLIFGVVILIEIYISWEFKKVAKNQNSDVYKLNFWREYYNQHRNLIQSDPEFAVYDKKTLYKLKKGNFEYFQPESVNKYSVNSFGLRDDENSLENPEIIALGDSYTMGWGVEQDQSFSEILEKKIGRKVLNAGISSFGTAREHMLFEQLDKDSCKVLLIQYCENDYLENEKLSTQKKDRFNESDYDSYDSQINLNNIYKSYFPFKNVLFLIRYSIQNFNLKSIFERKSNSENYFLKDEFTEKHTTAFFEIIKKIRKYYQGNILIFHTPAYEPTDKLSRAFDVERKKSNLPKIYISDTSKFFEKSDYYLLDGHIKPNAHQKLAENLYSIIQENNLLK